MAVNKFNTFNPWAMQGSPQGGAPNPWLSPAPSTATPTTSAPSPSTVTAPIPAPAPNPNDLGPAGSPWRQMEDAGRAQISGKYGLMQGQLMNESANRGLARSGFQQEATSRLQGQEKMAETELQQGILAKKQAHENEQKRLAQAAKAGKKKKKKKKWGTLRKIVGIAAPIVGAAFGGPAGAMAGAAIGGAIQ